MSLPKGPYDPLTSEQEILKHWIKGNYYTPEYAESLGAKEPFTIIMPPPNANGDLHLGHVSGYAYQDLMGRYQRMLGKKVLLLPGKDHAGIQSEVVYERELEKQGLKKKDLGREEFYKQVYEFCIRNGENARKQEQRIGISADFSRELFTLDPKIVADVLKTFLMMYDDKLIYRGKRIINWCPRCQSALADIDTEYKDAKTPFVYFKYGFAEPEEEAIRIKEKYSTQQEIEFRLSISKTTAYFAGEKPLVVTQEEHLFEDTYVDSHKTRILPLGYSKQDLSNWEFSGRPVGVEMQLDGTVRLVVANPTINISVNELIREAYLLGMRRYPGYHIILFDEYPEDKYYTNGFIIGTVRPETIFGDTALGVNPSDHRYKDFIGKEFEVKGLDGTKKFTIIADPAVDPEQGTGILKITPAHSVEDWEIATRHQVESLPEKQAIGFDGKLNHLAGKYEGMSVNEARRAIIADLQDAGMLSYLDTDYENRVKICERCKSRIEPLVSHQWFVNTRPLKAKAKKLVEDGITDIMPEGRKNVYLQWMDSDEDWCITRQLWWGYRIPVWYKGEKSEYVTETGEVREKIGGKIINSPQDYDGIMQTGIASPGEGWLQDPDVLDTWFSSGQWPYVTLQAKAGDFEQFYPTQVMETGWDILIFWVTRMMMLSTYRATKDGLQDGREAPFSKVYLHGLVLDKDGVKMSKSKGNGIDPTDMINKYGADALRMSFYAGSKPGENTRLYEEKVASFGKFLNKLWNASKFVLMNVEGAEVVEASEPKIEDLEHESNQKLLEHITNLKSDVTRLLDTFQFGVAAQILYNEFWHTFADVHVEAAKPHIYVFKNKETGEIESQPEDEEKVETQKILLLALREYLKMLHPFIPFITEAIWKAVPKTKEEHESIMYSKW